MIEDAVAADFEIPNNRATCRNVRFVRQYRHEQNPDLQGLLRKWILLVNDQVLWDVVI